MPKPREITDNSTKNKPWKPFKGVCVIKCPPGFIEKEKYINEKLRVVCEECKGIY